LSHIAGRRDGYRPESDVAVPPSIYLRRSVSAELEIPLSDLIWRTNPDCHVSWRLAFLEHQLMSIADILEWENA
jgi:hypothetical protein